MTVEELIAKLGFRVTGENEVRKFIRALDDARKGLDKLKTAQKGSKLDAKVNTSGLKNVSREWEKAAAAARKYRQEAERASRIQPGRSSTANIARDLDRATASARRFRQEMERASRVRPIRVPGAHHGGRPGAGAGGAGGGSGGGGGGGGDGIGVGTAAGAYAAGRLGGVPMSVIAAGAGAGVAIKTFADLESAARELGITAEQAREKVAKDVETFRTQATKLGVTPEKQVGIAKRFAAAGLDYNTAVGSVVPVADAAKASFAELESYAEAGIASVNNLKTTVGQMGLVFDIIAKGAKFGQVEPKELAKGLPTLTPSAQKLGMTGTKGLTDLVAAVEIGRKTSPTGEMAVNALSNLLEKAESSELSDAFEKVNVNIKKLYEQDKKKGVTKFDTLLNALHKATDGGKKGDVLNDLIGDREARNAATALMQNWKEFQKMRVDIEKQAPGTVQKDLKEANDRVTADLDKFTAALDRMTGRLGEFLAPLARAAANIGTGLLEGTEGKTQSDADRAKMVGKLNNLLGAPPTISTGQDAMVDKLNRLTGTPAIDRPPAMSADAFRQRVNGPNEPIFVRAHGPLPVTPVGGATAAAAAAASMTRRPAAKSMFGGAAGAPMAPLPTYAPPKPAYQAPAMAGMTPPTLGGAAQGANWAKQAVEHNTTENHTHNTDVGNDKRVQTASVVVHATGLAEVGALVRAQTSAALAGLGASVAAVKAGTTATGSDTAP